MTCPFLDYRDSAGEESFAVERAYCTAAGQFVQPLRADVCNDRYALDHTEHCEIFQAHADELAGGGRDGEPAVNGDEADR